MAPVIAPLTPDRWDDLARLFGANGANSGCWCMWWRVSAAEWGAGNDANRTRFASVVRDGRPAGLLAYADGEPVGWCALAPRPDYPRLLRSPTLRPPDPDNPGVWSVTCFYIHRRHRRSGVAAALLRAAITHAAEHGAAAVEGYPVDTRGERRLSGNLYTGTVGLFAAAGFVEQTRPATGTRVIMRRSIASSGH